jgi:hypothetical protein
MAPRRRKRSSPGQTRPYKLYLPADISDRIDQKAKATGWPLNRIIINELAAYPTLEELGKLTDIRARFDDLLAKHDARLMWQDLSDELLKAVDKVLQAKGGTALDAAIDRLRKQRDAMLESEKHK